MTSNEKNWVMNAVKEITIAKMDSTNVAPSNDVGELTAEFMDAVYEKLAELITR